MAVKGLTAPLLHWLRVLCLFVLVRGTFEEPPTRLIPWFSKLREILTLHFAASPSPLRGRPMQAQDEERRISGTVAGEVFAQVKTYQVPITNPSPSHLHYFPLVFLSPTSPLPFYSPSLSQSPLSFLLAFFCVLVCLFDLMAEPKGPDHLLRRMDEIESNIRSFMNLQF